ncbi:MAG TPA: hypothetical protein VEI97_19735 [bacterium]|nr:hypothetical protein [bacterium]
MGPETAEIVLLSERLLPEEDHGNRYLAATFGIVADAIERAARREGLLVEVVPIPALDFKHLWTDSGTIVTGHARVVGTGPREEGETLLRARRTSRLPYDGALVPGPALDAMAAVVGDLGHRFYYTADPHLVQLVLRQNAEAIIDNLQIPNERREIARWYRVGPTPVHGDGLWQEPMAQPVTEMNLAFKAPFVFQLPGIKRTAIRRYVKTMRGTTMVGLLCGPFKTWPELTIAGRTLLRFWLTMAGHGVVMHPFGSMLTNPEYARLVAQQFDVPDCWLIFRFGYSDPPPQSPRLASILLEP